MTDHESGELSLVQRTGEYCSQSTPSVRCNNFPFPYGLGIVLIPLRETSKAANYVLRNAIHRHHQVHNCEFIHLLHNGPFDSYDNRNKDSLMMARVVCRNMLENWQSVKNIRVMKTNLMHYLSSVHFVNQPLHVSGIFAAHHEEVYCIYATIGKCCVEKKDVQNYLNVSTYVYIYTL